MNDILRPTVRELLERLDSIRQRLRECQAPNVYDGYDQCPCGSGQTWPCRTTEAAWLAKGQEIGTQRRTILAELADAYMPVGER